MKAVMEGGMLFPPISAVFAAAAAVSYTCYYVNVT